VPLQSVVQAARGNLKIAGQNAVIKLEGLTIEITANQTEAKANGERIVLPSAPEKKIGRWYIPIQLLEAWFGLHVTKIEEPHPVISINTVRGPAAVYGYAADRNGNPVTEGWISFCTSDHLCMAYQVEEGLFRAALELGTVYTQVKLSAYQNNSPIWKDVVETTEIKLSKSDYLFRRYMQPASNVTFQVQYEDGKPVNGGTIEINNGRDSSPYRINNGDVLYSISGKAKLRVTYFKEDGESTGTQGNFGTFNVDPANGPITLKVIIHKPNVSLRVNAPEGMTDSLTFFMFNEDIIPMPNPNEIPLADRIYIFHGNGWNLDVNLPDGEYTWSYSLMKDGGSYSPDQRIIVRGGRATESVYVDDLPATTVEGQIKASDGSMVSGGHLSFYKVGSLRSTATCSISSTGTYSIRLKDGEYIVKVQDKDFAEHIIVSNGKANVTTLTFPSS
jgi:hypothetical protein